MHDSVTTNGYPSYEELRARGMYPSETRFQRGPVAVAECVQPIPCNPCASSCPAGAICIGEPITNLPKIDFDKCVGCGNCIAHCSGLAIFVIDKSFGDGSATVSFAHEYFPLPEKGQKVAAVNRAGTPVCGAEVLRINNSKKNDHTPVVTIKIPLEFADQVRGIQRLGSEVTMREETTAAAKSDGDSNGDVLVCRCEEVTVEEIRRAISEGCTTISAVKRRTRAGMGLCQGRTCSRIIARMLKEAGVNEGEPKPDTARFPLKPVEFGLFCEDIE